MSVGEISVGLWVKQSGATWARVRNLTGWQSLNVEFRHLQPGPWTMTFPFNDLTAGITKQHMVTVDFRGQRFTGVIEQRGPASSPAGSGRTSGVPGASLAIGGADAMTLLGDATCWPLPTSALAAQSTAHYVASGVAETVLRGLIVANLVTRRGDGISVAASQGRGGTVRLNERFTNLLAVVTAKCALVNLGVHVGLVSSDPSSTRASLTCWFDQPQDMTRRITLAPKAGTLRSWQQEDVAPTATQVIVGGGGKGTSRIFRVATSSAAESEWGRKRELFVDQRNSTDLAELDEAGSSALTDAAAQSSFSLEATDAVGTLFGPTFKVGDRVTIDLGIDGVSRTDVLSVAVLKSEGSGGSTVELKPGNPDAADVMFQQAAIIRGLRRELKALQAEES